MSRHFPVLRAIPRKHCSTTAANAWGLDALEQRVLLAAAPIIDVGLLTLAANRPHQTITLFVSGADPVSAFILNAQLGDGTGPAAEPVFESVNFAGGIWDGHDYTVMGGPLTADGIPQDVQASVALDNTGDSVTANGQLVKLVVDTTGFSAGQSFALKLASTEIEADSHFVLAGGVDLPAAVTNGTITLVNATVAAPVIGTIASDTGTPGDRITSDRTLLISGTSDPNVTITLYRGDTSLGVTTANGAGAWTFDYTATSLSDGQYTFTATAEDSFGTVSALSAAAQVTVDGTAPSASIASIPNQASSIGSIDITFSEPISGLTPAQLQFTRDGSPITLGGGQTLTSTDNIHWTLSGLTSLTGRAGTYQLNVPAGTATDVAGNPVTATSGSWKMDTIRGSASAETITIKKHTGLGNVAEVQVGSDSYTLALDGLAPIYVNGVGGADSLVVNFGNGDPLPGGVLNLSGGDLAITTTGTPTQYLTLNIDSAVARLPQAIALANVTTSNGGRLSIDFQTDGSNPLKIYTGDLSRIWNLVCSGYASGAWNGSGIGTSQITNTTLNGLGLVLGTDGAGAQYIGVREMILGDVNGDDKVTIGDVMVALNSANYQQDGTWLNGDVNYDGKVTIGDVMLMLNSDRYQQSFQPSNAPAITEAAASVPVAPNTLSAEPVPGLATINAPEPIIATATIKPRPARQDPVRRPVLPGRVKAPRHHTMLAPQPAMCPVRPGWSFSSRKIPADIDDLLG